jgi:hypothetical protein
MQQIYFNYIIYYCMKNKYTIRNRKNVQCASFPLLYPPVLQTLQGVQRLERDADCSPASSTKIKNAWRCIFTRLHGVYSGEFTFHFTTELTVKF